MEKVIQEKQLLNYIECSQHALLFRNEARILLVENLTNIQTVYRDSVNANDIVVNMLSMPKLARQQIERVCLNNGNMRGTIKLLDEIFKYETKTFFQFLYNLIINKQGDLVIKLIEEIKIRQPIVFSSLNMPNTSFSSSLPFLSSQKNFSNTLPVDLAIKKNQSSFSNLNVEKNSTSQKFGQNTFPTSNQDTDINNLFSAPLQVDNTRNHFSSRNNYFSTPNTADNELLKQYTELRNDVTEYFGSLEKFFEHLQQKRLERNQGQRQVFEDTDVIRVESFDFQNL